MKLCRVRKSMPIPGHAVGSSDPNPGQRHRGVLHPVPDCDRRGVCEHHRPRDSRDPLQAALLIGNRDRHRQASNGSGDRYAPPLECRARRRGGRQQDSSGHNDRDQPPRAEAAGAGPRTPQVSHAPTIPSQALANRQAVHGQRRAPLRRRRPAAPDGPRSQSPQSSGGAASASIRSPRV